MQLQFCITFLLLLLLYSTLSWGVFKLLWIYFWNKICLEVSQVKGFFAEAMPRCSKRQSVMPWSGMHSSLRASRAYRQPPCSTSCSSCGSQQQYVSLCSPDLAVPVSVMVGWNPMSSPHRLAVFQCLQRPPEPQKKPLNLCLEELWVFFFAFIPSLELWSRTKIAPSTGRETVCHWGVPCSCITIQRKQVLLFKLSYFKASQRFMQTQPW